jgi:UDP-N-acetylmuramoyl-tripeptide--D-alanyl-D-alanine ligase
MKIIDFKNIVGIVEVFGSFSDKEVVLTTDSRSINGQNVFLALKGENFDGFTYLTQALEQGVEVAIYTDAPGRSEQVKSLSENYPNTLFISVNNTQKYLQDSAAWWVRKWQKDFAGKVLGLTGSNGKTTTKELLYAQAEKIFGDKVMCTAGNFNNHIGVPLTIFNIKEEHEFAIVEMGTNHPGEIEVLCNIANPNYGLITNVGAAHLEFLISEEGVLQEKAALYRYINENGGRFFLNKNDPNLNKLETTKNVTNFGEEGENFLESITNSHIQESYNLWNLRAAYFVLSEILPESKELLLENTSKIKLPDNKRSQWIEDNGKVIFLDAYNANPTSMKSALKSFANKYAQQQEKALYVLGDMNELGDLAQQFHEEVSLLMNDLKIENAIFVGRYAHFYADKFAGRCDVFANREELDDAWIKVSNSYQYIFLKASRSLQLESLIDITD